MYSAPASSVERDEFEFAVMGRDERLLRCYDLTAAAGHNLDAYRKRVQEDARLVEVGDGGCTRLSQSKPFPNAVCGAWVNPPVVGSTWFWVIPRDSDRVKCAAQKGTWRTF